MSQGYYARHESSAGAMLTAGREELNLSVSDVARHLKLSPAQVEALEEGAYDRLPGRVFVRGFLRNYAKLLGIDPQPLLRTIEHEMPQPTVVDEPPPSPEVVMPREQPARWPMQLMIAAAVIVAALAVYEFGFNEPPGRDEPASETAAGASSAEVSAATPPAPSIAAAPATPTPQPTPQSAAPAPSATSVPAAGAQPGRPQGELATAGTEAPAALPTGQRALLFRFEQDSWVEVRDRNDKIIFSKLNRVGAEERVTGTPPFKLVVGNARGVRLEYDSKSVDLAPHIGVTVARLTLQ